MGPHTSARGFLSAAASQARHVLRSITDALERRRTHQFVAVLAITLAISGLAGKALTHARSLERSWTTARSVLVTSRPIAIGEAITRHNTRNVRLPEALIARDALVELRAGVVARINLTERTALTSSMIDADSSRIVLPPGWRGVGLPADLIAPAVGVGDRVDIVATGAIVATDAIVVGVDAEQRITVAVPSASAATVATAARLGEVSLILSS